MWRRLNQRLMCGGSRAVMSWARFLKFSRAWTAFYGLRGASGYATVGGTLLLSSFVGSRRLGPVIMRMYPSRLNVKPVYFYLRAFLLLLCSCVVRCNISFQAQPLSPMPKSAPGRSITTTAFPRRDPAESLSALPETRL